MLTPVRVHLDAGILSRRANGEQLRDALERLSTSVEPLLESGGTVDAPGATTSNGYLNLPT